MQLSDLLTTTQVDAMRQVVTSTQCDAQNYAPNLSDKVRDQLFGFATLHNGNYNRKFWQSLNYEYTQHPDVMICVSGKQITIATVQLNRVFARHIGECLKRGDVICWIRNSSVIVVDWSNWKSVYSSLTKAPDTDTLPTPPSRREMRVIRENRRREHAFGEMAKNPCSKKLGKKGYNLTFDEIRARQRMEAMEKAQRTVISEARKIYEAVC